MNSRPMYAITACVGFVLTASLWAQNALPAGRIGIPQDWSEHSLAFSLSTDRPAIDALAIDGLAQNPGSKPDSMSGLMTSDLMTKEPRILHQMMHRFPGMFPGLFRGTANVRPLDVHPTNVLNSDGRSPNHSRDWSVNLVKGHISPEMYPAKYSFDASAPPSCTNDFVVFGLATAAATGGQANLVAFNNLYIGAGGYCSGSVPSLLFAYNTTTGTGGKIITSPVLSLDGTKIAFVESLGTSSVFHVLTWAAGQGQITDAAAPTMTSLTFSNSANTSTSSPWIDYADDVVYVADDNGIVHKITPVFNGTPALAGSPWVEPLFRPTGA